MWLPLTSGERCNEFKVSGYADDTAVYLHDRAAILQVVTILDDSASVSGLVTNRSKSVIVALDPRGSALPLITCGLTLMTSSKSCRYMGVLVGQQDAVADNWNKCIRSLHSRLVLVARGRNHTVEQLVHFQCYCGTQDHLPSTALLTSSIHCDPVEEHHSGLCLGCPGR